MTQRSAVKSARPRGGAERLPLGRGELLQPGDGGVEPVERGELLAASACSRAARRRRRRSGAARRTRRRAPRRTRGSGRRPRRGAPPPPSCGSAGRRARWRSRRGSRGTGPSGRTPRPGGSRSTSGTDATRIVAPGASATSSCSARADRRGVVLGRRHVVEGRPADVVRADQHGDEIRVRGGGRGHLRGEVATRSRPTSRRSSR